MAKKIGILRFLGTNCDRDVFSAVESLGLTPEWLWYEDQFPAQAYDAIIVPGGFSYGDYLRSGALAAKAVAMKSVLEAVKKDVPVIGICNGFQILCETHVLPGVLMKNENGKFIDEWVELEVTAPSQYTANQKRVRYPIAHGDGRYFVTSDELKRIQDQDQVWLRYFENPNGSTFDIAGVKSKDHHVYGLMPHPERALYEWMGGADGQNFFEGLLK